MKLELNSTDWQDVLGDNNAQSAYTTFHNKICDIFYRNCPMRQIKHKKNLQKSPWITSGILKSIHRKNVLYSSYKQSPTYHNSLRYRSFKNKLTTVVRKAKALYYKNYFDQNKANSKKIWSGINSILNKGFSNTNDTGISGKLTDKQNDPNNIQICANNFNDFFTSIGENLASKIGAPTNNFHSYLSDVNIQDTFILHPVSHEEVITIIYSLPCKKSSGYDEITNDVLKHICNYIVDPLTHILNLSFSEGVFPDELKIAKVIPIYKSGSVDDLSNYRPVSILPAISKIFERLAYNRLSAFVNKNSLLYSGQYGFRKDHSTYMAALKVVDDIVCNLDNRISTVALFVDLSKAFDTINHNILERKLYIYGI